MPSVTIDNPPVSKVRPIRDLDRDDLIPAPELLRQGHALQRFHDSRNARSHIGPHSRGLRRRLRRSSRWDWNRRSRLLRRGPLSGRSATRDTARTGSRLAGHKPLVGAVPAPTQKPRIGPPSTESAQLNQEVDDRKDAATDEMRNTSRAPTLTSGPASISRIGTSKSTMTPQRASKPHRTTAIRPGVVDLPVSGSRVRRLEETAPLPHAGHV